MLFVIDTEKHTVRLPIHWPVVGRIIIAPIPAPIEAKTRDALHLTVIMEIFLPRSFTFSDVSSVSSSCLDLKNRQISMPT